MRARLGPEDEEAFNAARDELIEAFRSAAEDDADDFVASTMLD